MANAQFEHHGHRVTIVVLHIGERWTWSYQIHDRIPVANVETGARTEGAALHEARHEAIAAIKALVDNP
ncbi:hypothetical protein [Variovorax ginsengisoli]|uniref:DUF1508 domain-containing protein n=1 Tax=Variovorax ginsengisoli TaxID=363844 RepID=A0ABT8SG07_9BURK|nr:hypothetical protein [Variovorax ginsengisoli]MDN8618695.1 hypothetical protein [Variovorax ginsengisoli]MDO1537865.1 hypothetical protein [Variovorax ginsengisoli]